MSTKATAKAKTKAKATAKAGAPAATPATTTVWQYPKCSTCRKALRWLADHDVAVDAVDLVASPPAGAKLRDLWKRSGLPIAKMFNTSGESYRAGGFKEKLGTLSEAGALAALAADGKLIKRPIIDTGDGVLVGFDEAALAATFAPRRRS